MSNAELFIEKFIELTKIMDKLTKKDLLELKIGMEIAELEKLKEEYRNMED